MAEECPICNGTGFELKTREDGTLAARRCACEQDDEGRRRLDAARIPRRYEHCTLDSFEIHHPSQARALEAAREWVAQWPAVGHGLLLLGRPGTGKTHLAVGISRAVVQDKGARVLFREQRELLKALQGTFDSGSAQRESEILGPVLEAEILVLDDLGAGRTTPWARDVMHDVIAHRYNERKLMIITSNHRLVDESESRRATASKSLDAPLTLRDRLGEALVSRLYEMCRIVRLELKRGQDYRREIMNAEHPR